MSKPKTKPENKIGKKIRLMKAEIRENKSTFIIYTILRILVIAALCVSLFRGNYENAFICAISLLLFIVPFFIESNFSIELPSTLEIIILLFIFAAEILGELQCYYIKFPYWDSMLHVTNGFICAAVGFALTDIINRNPRFKFELSPLFLAVVSFCFSMTIGVLWEFLEFGCDNLIHTDMQKDSVLHSITSVMLDPSNQNRAVTIDNIDSVIINGKDPGVNGYLDIGLIDTMKDMIVNCIGAVIFSFIGYFYIKGRGKGHLAKHFIPTLKGQDN